MTISWGNKLLIVFVVFAANIAYMVYRCTQTDVGLVATEYYKDELAYQQVIDGTNLANALHGKVSLLKSDGDIILQLPQDMKNVPVKGSILFYCTSNGSNDRKINLQVDENGRQVIDAKQLEYGNYMVKITWDAQSKHYYHEQPFTIL